MQANKKQCNFYMLVESSLLRIFVKIHSGKSKNFFMKIQIDLHTVKFNKNISPLQIKVLCKGTKQNNNQLKWPCNH